MIIENFIPRFPYSWSLLKFTINNLVCGISERVNGVNCHPSITYITPTYNFQAHFRHSSGNPSESELLVLNVNSAKHKIPSSFCLRKRFKLFTASHWQKQDSLQSILFQCIVLLLSWTSWLQVRAWKWDDNYFLIINLCFLAERRLLQNVVPNTI